MRLVVDASEEEESASAHGLLESRLGRSGLLELVATEFSLMEVVAVMGRRARSGSVQPDYPAQVLQASRKLRLGLTPDAELLDHAAQLSTTLRHPVYDCLYLALSRRLSAPIAAFDAALSEIAQRDGRLWNLR